MAVAANLPPHVKHYLAACSQAQINQMVSSLQGVESKRTVAAVVAAGDPTLASGSRSKSSSSNSNSLQASSSSTSQSHGMISASSPKSTSSSVQPVTPSESHPDSASSNMTTIQPLTPDSSSSTTHPEAGTAQGSLLRALNSFMAYRVYYNPIFHSFEQKERSGFMKTMWAEEETKAKWSIIAKAWSIIRDEVGKDSAPLDKFLELACPHIDILDRNTYLSTLGWELVSQNGDTSLRRNFTPNFDAFPASFRTTTKSVQDVIDFVRSSGYGVSPDDTPVVSINTSTSHITMAAQPVHHSTATAISTFLPSSIFHSTNSSGGNINSQPPSTFNLGGQQSFDYVGATGHSAAQTASIRTATTLNQTGSTAHAGAGESGQDVVMDIDGTEPPAQQQTSNAMTAHAVQAAITSVNPGPAQSNTAGAQSNNQAIMAAIHQHAAAANAGNGGGTGGLLTGGPMTHQQMLDYMYGTHVQHMPPDFYGQHVDDSIMNPDPRLCVMQRTSFADPDLLAISINTSYPNQIMSYYPASTRAQGSTMPSGVMRPTGEEDAHTAWVNCAMQPMETSSTLPYAEFFSPESQGLTMFDIDQIPAFTAIDCVDFQFSETTLPLVTSQWNDDSDDTEQ